MNHRCPMRAFHGRADLQEKLKPRRDRESALPHELRYRHARDELHDEIRQAVIRRAGTEEARNIWMIVARLM